MNPNDIRCPVCNRLLGKVEGAKINIIHGDRSSRVHGQGVVILDCDRCPGKAEVVLPNGAVA